jgi:iron complex outermembrane receptor protein
MSEHPRLTVVAAVAAALASAAAANAQTAAAGDPQSATVRKPGTILEEVIVTARRQAEPLQDVPLSVTAFDDARLQELRIADRTALADYTPSLFTITGGYPREFAYFALRGQGPAFGSVPGVVNYFAEVPNLVSIDGRVGTYFDLENIQVLAGPQGTLFGKNATGGNILFEPARPVNASEGYVRAEFGNYNDRRIEGAINVPMADGKVLLRVAGELGQRDGYTKDVGPNFAGRDYDNLDYDSLRVGLTLRPFEGFENYTLLRYYESDNNGPGTVLTAINPVFTPLIGLFFPQVDNLVPEQEARGPRKVSYEIDEFSKTEYWQVINQTSYEFSESLTLKNILSYSEFRNNYGYDYDASPLPLAGQSSRNIPTTAPNFFTEEFQLQGSAFDDSMTYVAGAYMDRMTWDDPSGIQEYTVFPASVLIGTLAAHLDIENHSEAIFGQTTFDLGHYSPGLAGLSLTTGLRYTWEHSFSSTTIFAPPAPTTAAGSVDSDYLSYNVTLDYDITPNVHTYITARDAYKSGGFNGPVPEGSPFRTFPPEKLTDVEIGLKSQFSTDSVEFRANIAAYRGDYQDIQRTTPEDVGGIVLNVTRSAAEGRIQGVEFTGTMGTLFGLTLNGSYSYIDSEYTKVTDDSAEAILEGAPFPYTPQDKYSIGASYDTQLGSFARLVLSANYAHQSEVSTAQTNQSFYKYLPAYGSMTAGIDFKDVAGRPLDVGFFMSNVEDVARPVGVLDQYVTGPSGTVGLTYMEPRMYGVRIGYRFGE